MTTVCIHQPDFVPYLGFFDRLKDSEIYIVLDNVQFIRRGWHHRDKIRTRTGSQWLTLAIRKDDYHQTINNIYLSNDFESDWKKDNLALIAENYRHADAYDSVFPVIERLYHSGGSRLVDFNMAFIRYLLDILDIEVDIRFASDLGGTGEKTDRLVDLVRMVGGTKYVTGTGSIGYLETEKFRAAGIDVEIRAYKPLIYPQQFSPFVENLSALDLALNCGNKARDYL